MLIARHGLLALVALAVVACNGGSASQNGMANPIAVDLEPQSAEVGPSAPVQFQASVTGTANVAVTWSVSEAGGGTVDATGLYVAPSSAGTYHIVATSAADPNVSATATVFVSQTPPPPATGDCANAPLRTSGTIYYYCSCDTGAEPACVPGNDANTGTSASAPRRTFGSAATRFGSMRAGDTIALCRGGSWNEGGVVLRNSACNVAGGDAGACYFRDYAPPWGGTARPRLNTGGSSAFTYWDSDRTYEALRLWNLDIRLSDRSYPGGPVAIRFFGPKSGFDLCNLNVQGASIGLQTDNEVRYLTVRNSTFTKNGWDAMYVESPHLTVDGNSFVNNGDQNVNTGLLAQAHTVYVACNNSANPCPGIVIKNNYFRNDANGSWDVPGGGFCGGVMLILRGYLPGIRVENNYLTSAGAPSPYACSAISLSGSYAYTEIHDAVIARNRVKWTTYASQGIQADACINCTLSDNIIDLDAGGRGIVSPSTSNAEDPNFAVTTGTIVQNNTVRLSAAGEGMSVGIAGEGTGFVVENNAIWVPSGSRALSVNRPTLRNSNNHTVSDGSPATRLWVDPVTGNFRPLSSGPLVGSANATYFSPTAVGSIAWSATDGGVQRVYSDIGAMQR